MAYSRVGETLVGGFAHGRAPEIIRRETRSRKRSGHAIAAQINGRLNEIACPLARSQNQRHAAIVDKTIIEQMQRLADVTRGMIIGEREGGARSGGGIKHPLDRDS